MEALPFRFPFVLSEIQATGLEEYVPLRMELAKDLPAAGLIWGVGIAAYGELFLKDSLALILRALMPGVAISPDLDLWTSRVLVGIFSYTYALAIGNIPLAGKASFVFFIPGVNSNLTLANHISFYLTYALSALSTGLSSLENENWAAFTAFTTGMFMTMTYLHRDSVARWTALEEQVELKKLGKFFCKHPSFVLTTTANALRRGVLYGAIGVKFANYFESQIAAYVVGGAGSLLGAYMNVGTQVPKDYMRRIEAEENINFSPPPESLPANLKKYAQTNWGATANNIALGLSACSQAVFTVGLIYTLVPDTTAAISSGLILGAFSIPQYYGFMQKSMENGTDYIGATLGHVASLFGACCTRRNPRARMQSEPANDSNSIGIQIPNSN